MAHHLWTIGKENAATDTAKGPLAGVRILDMSSVVMGPFATLIMADLGADIIKVENEHGARAGDLMRYAGDSPTDDLGPIFMALNRNKNAVTIDARSDKGKAQITQLAKEADVLFHNIRMAGMERLGLGYDDVAAINPEIIYVHCAGYGANGPYSSLQAYDDLIQAASGYADLYRKRDPEAEPSYAPTLIADKTVGLFATYATLAALYHRERTGEGQFVSVPMFESFTFFNMVENLYGETFLPGNGKMGYTRSINPRRRPYPSKDGHIAIVPYIDSQWERFFEIGGKKGVFNDPRFSTYTERTKNISALYEIIEEVAQTKTTDEWLDILRKEHIPAMRFNAMEDVLNDPHLKSTGFFQEEHDPHIGAFRSLKHPVQFSKCSTKTRQFPQSLGAQNDRLKQLYAQIEEKS